MYITRITFCPYHFARAILYVPFCPLLFCPIPFCPHNILSSPYCPYHFLSYNFNPLTPTAYRKLLEIIDIVRIYPSCSFATALDSDINQTTGSGGHLSMWENRCMHAAVCLLRAGQPRSAGDAVKLGQFIGKFSWVTGDPIGVKGLIYGGGSFIACESDWSEVGLFVESGTIFSPVVLLFFSDDSWSFRPDL